MIRPLAIALAFVLVTAPEAEAGPTACRAALEASGGRTLFSESAAAASERCAAQVEANLGAGAGAMQCLLLVHDATGVKPALDERALAAVERLVRETPFAGAIGLAPPAIEQGMQLLSLVAPERALGLARLLTAVGAPPWQVARGARTIAALGTDQDLYALALHFVSLDVELRATALRAAALRSSPAVNPMVLPVLTDADERIARAAYEGFALAPRPEEPALLRVLRGLPPARRAPFLEALLDRTQPRRGRPVLDEPAFAEEAWTLAETTCADPKLARPLVRVALRLGSRARFEATVQLLESASREGPLPCDAWRRDLAFGIAEQVRGSNQPENRAYRRLVRRFVRASPRGSFDLAERAMADGLGEGKPARLASFLRKPATVRSAVAAVGWGGGPAEAKELRAFALEALGKPVAGCESPTLLLEAYGAVTAAEARAR